GSGNVLSVAFSADGKMLANGSVESEQGMTYGAVRIWDTRLAAERQKLKAYRDAATFVTFSPAGSVLASGGLDDTMKLWNVRTGELMRTVKIAVPKWSGVLQCVFSPDGKTLASGSQDGKVRLWDVSGLK